MHVQQLRAEAYAITEFEALGPVALVVVEMVDAPPCMLISSVGETWCMHPPLGDRRSLREIIRESSAEDLSQRLRSPGNRLTFHMLQHRLRLARAIKAANDAGLLE